MSRTLVMRVVAGVLVDADGQLLLGQRPQDKELGGLWEFPGGKLEPGEDDPSALRRELNEELGIIVTRMGKQAITVVHHPYRERELVLAAYRVDAWQGRIVAREHQALRWCSAALACQLPKPSGDADILQAFIRHQTAAAKRV